MKKIASYTPVAVAVAALLQTGVGYAQESLKLDEVVVTSSSTAKSKMRSSVSVTDVDQDAIKDMGARSEAEVLMMIPGVRTDPSTGPAGNANITVRGLPIASGGAKYVQLQEDGLPVVQFGDMNFGNNDYWTRFDNNVDSIQALRGGSASVFASHAPGAVINYISKTGKEQGGSIGLTRGLNYNETRVDGDVGGKIGTDMYYHVGGYFRQGEGVRNTTADAMLGYQIKGNITKEFNGAKGYVRLNMKALDEHAPVALGGGLLTATQSGNTIGNFGLLSSIDGTRASSYSNYGRTVAFVDPVTGANGVAAMNGITSKSKSVGFEFHNELTNGYTVDNKFRINNNSGSFQAQFWDVSTLPSMLAGFGAGATAKFANGPQAGAIVGSGTLVSKGGAANVQIGDLGSIVNDISVSKKFKADVGTFDLRGGMYISRQAWKENWAISERIMEATQNGAAIDVFNAAGAAMTTMGLTGYNNQWGACCARSTDVNFTTTAPYFGASLESGNWDFDGGIRQESFSANGTYAGAKQVIGGMDVNKDGVITGAEKNVYVADISNPGLVNYKVNYTNYSLGVNYRVDKDLSVFARNSKGHRAIADRLLYSGNVNAVTGALTSGGKSAAVAPVVQNELGIKSRGNTAWGKYALSATLFNATTTEYDYDQTRQDDPSRPGYQGPKLNVVGYKTNGVEFESGMSFGNLGINLNAVYSDETQTSNLGDPSMVGKTSAGVPKWRYNISPRYAVGDAVFGAIVRGQSKVFADNSNTTAIDGHYIVNAFANYDFGQGLIGSLNVNNIFNKIYPTGGGSFISGSPTVFSSGVNNGRTMSATLRYKF
jgi:outer membrane receptor protein involved in Fe transport